VNAFQLFADGPRVHEYLAEMTHEVFAGRAGEFITVGEMPGVTPEQARHYTGEDRGELNMVFQFEHVQLDQSTFNKFDYLGLDRVALKKSLHRWQRELAATGWNSSTGTTMTSPGWCPGSATTTRTSGTSQRPPWPRSCTGCAGPVRLPGRRARHDQLPVHLRRRAP
jgi:glycosidase